MTNALKAALRQLKALLPWNKPAVSTTVQMIQYRDGAGRVRRVSVRTPVGTK